MMLNSPVSSSYWDGEISSCIISLAWHIKEAVHVELRHYFTNLNGLSIVFQKVKLINNTE